MSSPKRSTVLVFDNVDLDNPLAAKTAFHEALGLNPVAVIVTGRPATRNRKAKFHKFDPAYTQEVRTRNARRMKGFLMRAGVETSVWEGLIPPATVEVVPHRIHVDEANMDLHDDFHRVRADGTFAQAMRFLSQIEGQLDFVVGGPLSEAAAIMQNPQLFPKLGTMTCQLGLFNFGQATTMAGEGITFNSGADRDSTLAVLKGWPKPLYMVPTDVTKRSDVGVDTPRDLHSFGIRGELVKMWEIFYRDARLKERGERIYMHDVHPVFLKAQLQRRLARPLYTWERVRIDSVGPKGEIRATFGGPVSSKQRYVVKTVDPVRFRKALIAALRTT